MEVVAPYVRVEDWLLEKLSGPELRVYLSVFSFAGSGADKVKNLVKGVSQSRMADVAGVPLRTWERGLQGCKSKGALTAEKKYHSMWYRKASKGKRYAQVPIQSVVRHMAELTNSEIKCLIALSIFASSDGVVWPTRAVLADMTGLLPPNVSRAKRGLTTKGFISKPTIQDVNKGTKGSRIQVPTPYKKVSPVAVDTPSHPPSVIPPEVSPVAVDLPQKEAEKVSPVAGSLELVDKKRTNKACRSLVGLTSDGYPSSMVVFHADTEIDVSEKQADRLGASARSELGSPAGVGSELFSRGPSSAEVRGTAKQERRELADYFVATLRSKESGLVWYANDRIILLKSLKIWQESDWSAKHIRLLMDRWFRESFVKAATWSDRKPRHKQFIAWVNNNRGQVTPKDDHDEVLAQLLDAARHPDV
jgi:hypothetical protein